MGGGVQTSAGSFHFVSQNVQFNDTNDDNNYIGAPGPAKIGVV